MESNQNTPRISYMWRRWRRLEPLVCPERRLVLSTLIQENRMYRRSTLVPFWPVGAVVKVNHTAAVTVHISGLYLDLFLLRRKRNISGSKRSTSDSFSSHSQWVASAIASARLGLKRFEIAESHPQKTMSASRPMTVLSGGIDREMR